MSGHHELHAWEHADQLWKNLVLVPCVKVQIHFVNDDEPPNVGDIGKGDCSIFPEVEVAHDGQKQSQKGGFAAGQLEDGGNSGGIA